MSIRSDRRYRFEQPVDEVWAALAAVERYRTWWPWLREFDGHTLAAGESWHCVVKPQLPYTVEFTIDITEVVDREHAIAELSGQIEGPARITLAAQASDVAEGSEPGTSWLRLVSELSANTGVPRLVDRFVPFLASAGHDWVLDNGIGQFRSGAFR